jgi:hypothetical protein
VLTSWKAVSETSRKILQPSKSQKKVRRRHIFPIPLFDEYKDTIGIPHAEWYHVESVALKFQPCLTIPWTTTAYDLPFMSVANIQCQVIIHWIATFQSRLCMRKLERTGGQIVIQDLYSFKRSCTLCGYLGMDLLVEISSPELSNMPLIFVQFDVSMMANDSQ